MARILTAAGIQTEAVVDIFPHLWGKLLVNIGINALTAIHNCPNGALLENPAWAARITTQSGGGGGGREARHHAWHDPQLTTPEVCRATAANLSSMLQDVRARRMTEIMAINGALIRLARNLGLPVAVNEELVRQVQELERNYHEFS